MNFWEVTKNFCFKFLNRFKPRLTFRWIFSAVVWLIILVYVGLGVYFGIQIYKDKNSSQTIKISSYFYPFPAVIVNGKVVWASAYFQQLSYIQQYSVKTKDSSYVEADFRQKIIDTLVENEVVEFQALRYNLRINNREFNDAYSQVVDKAGGETTIKKVLNDLYGMSEREFKTLFKQQLLKEKIRNELIVQVDVSHIFVKNEDRANEVADKAKKGEDFAGLAKTYSEDVKSNQNGGKLGWLARGELVIENNPIPEFDTAAFAAKTGDIVGPIKTAAGFEIVKIEGKKGVIDENFTTWLSELKSESKVWRLIK